MLFITIRYLFNFYIKKKESSNIYKKIYKKKFFKHHNLYKIDNKLPFIASLKRSPFFFFLLLLCKANNVKTNFEVLKCKDFKEIFSKNSYLTMQATGKTETKKILSYYALLKIHLRKHKSYFRFILLHSDDINLNPGPCTDILPFSNSSFSINHGRIFLTSNDENSDVEKWKNVKKKDLHFVHVNINSLLPK